MAVWFSTSLWRSFLLSCLLYHTNYCVIGSDVKILRYFRTAAQGEPYIGMWTPLRSDVANFGSLTIGGLLTPFFFATVFRTFTQFSLRTSMKVIHRCVVCDVYCVVYIFSCAKRALDLPFKEGWPCEHRHYYQRGTSLLRMLVHRFDLCCIPFLYVVICRLSGGHLQSISKEAKDYHMKKSDEDENQDEDSKF